MKRGVGFLRDEAIFIDIRPRQVGVDIEIKPRGPLLDLAKHEVLHGVEADRAQLQGLLHGCMQVIDVEGLEQTQDLHILAAPHLEHARLHQAAQSLELFGQLPFRQRRSLVQRIDLALDQRKVMDRVEDHILALITL